MKQLTLQLEARTRRAASRLDAACAWAMSWIAFPASPAMYTAAGNAKPGFVTIQTVTDVHARRPQEPSP